MEDNRDHFTFFLSFREQIDLCDEKDQLRLYRAITDYALFRRDTTFTEPLLNMAWIGIKPLLKKSWIKYQNASKSKGVPKPSMVGNKNAAKDSDLSDEIKAKSKRNQSGINPIGMECNGMDSTSSSSVDDGDDDISVDWKRFVEKWTENAWSKKTGSPLSNLQYESLRDSQKKIVKQRIIDCMNEYSVPLSRAKDMVFRVIRLASDDSDKNYLRNSKFNNIVNFNWLFGQKKNFFDVLDGNYMKKR